MLVTPSRFESFGLMLVEGMMFGKPVIGCRAGGMVEVVENAKTGWRDFGAAAATWAAGS
jgi:glycogen(starch) synthase